MATETNPARRIIQLREELEQHNQAYHGSDNPAVSDQEYDQLFQELQRLEAAHPQLKSDLSPTGKVGAPAKNTFQQVRHKEPMLSLANAHSEQDFRDWLKRVNPNNQPMAFTCEPKMDGLAVRLEYRNGVLQRAATRGDGQVGEDVTNNLLTIPEVPRQLNWSRNYKGHPADPEPGSTECPEYLDVRGEVFMTKRSLKEVNVKRIAKGEPELLNTRNAAAGGLRQLDPREARERQLSFYAYSWRNPPARVTGHHQGLQQLQHAGLPTVDRQFHCETVDQVIRQFKQLQQDRQSLDYDIDGMVIKVDDLTTQNQLGNASREPRWAIAWKFPPEGAVTTLLDIEISHGRFGRLTPVAVLSAVQLHGITVRSASLHNEEDIHRKNLRIGDKVVVERAGDVIPQVTRPANPVDTENFPMFQMPADCPSCGQKVTTVPGEVGHWCENDDCPSRLPEQLTHFVGRSCMDIDGLGETWCKLLIEHGLVSNPGDLYHLTREQLLTLPRMGNSMATRILNGIEASRHRPLNKVFYGLGIYRLGRDVSKTLMEVCSSVQQAQQLTVEQLTWLPNIGGTIAEATQRGLQQPRVNHLLERMAAGGAVMAKLPEDRPGYGTVEATNQSAVQAGAARNEEEKRTMEQSTQSRTLNGQTYVVTGKIEGYTRTEVEGLIQQHGGRVASSVNKNVNWLVVGEKAGSKLKKAQQLDIGIMDAKTFFAHVEGRINWPE